MKVEEFAELINGKIKSISGGQNEVTSGFTCDLLSWVMAKGRPGCAWVTVQTHMNVIAVASLHDMACIVCPEGIEMDATCIERAEQEGIAIVESPLSAYEICGLLYAKNIPAVGD